MDPRPVFHVIGLLVSAIGIAMLLPAIIDIAASNRDYRVFCTSALFCVVSGAMVTLATHGGAPVSLSLRQAFLLTALSWVVVPAIGATPFIGLGLSYTDAFFESMSGITTTGSTVIIGLDTLPPGMLFWRALLQWIGGVGIIVMAIVMLPFLRVGGMQLFSLESSEKSEKIVPKAFDLVAWIVGVYGALTAMCAIAYAVAEMSIFDAICHAMTTLSTGGYSNHDASFGYFTNPLTQWFGTLFMFAGALPFIAYIKMLRSRHPPSLRNDPQVRAFTAFLVVVSLFLAIWLFDAEHFPIGRAITQTAFNVTSVVTTTGFASANYTEWGPLAAGVFLLLTFVGGCAGSTTGAIKIYRFQILWIFLRIHLLRLVRPHRAVEPKYAGRVLPRDVPTSVLAFLAMFFGTVAIFTVALTAMGLDLVTALSASATAIANVGPGLGPLIGPAGTFAPLPDVTKWILSAAMLLGRLELFTVIILLDPEFWRG